MCGTPHKLTKIDWNWQKFGKTRQKKTNKRLKQGDTIRTTGKVRQKKNQKETKIDRNHSRRMNVTGIDAPIVNCLTDAALHIYGTWHIDTIDRSIEANVSQQKFIN